MLLFSCETNGPANVSSGIRDQMTNTTSAEPETINANTGVYFPEYYIEKLIETKSYVRASFAYYEYYRLRHVNARKILNAANNELSNSAVLS
jgi:hypothetical protein